MSKLIDSRVEKIIKSGCVDFDSYGDDFILPKAFISAIGTEIKFQFKPHTEQGIQDSKNIEHFM